MASYILSNTATQQYSHTAIYLHINIMACVADNTGTYLISKL